jgi:hypothetical protein
MLDLNHLPKLQTGNIDYFLGETDKNAGAWKIWEKPRGINMIQITCIGGGAGGGGGVSNTNNGARGGGAGGSSGGFTTLSIPAIFLPDILYVSAGGPGSGGFPGNPAGLGGYGIGSYVSVAPYSPILITTTSATTTATATSTVNHNLTTGDSVIITGATPGQYNGIYTVTVTSATTFTYAITSTTPTASSPGTGTIYATKLNELSNVCYANGGFASSVQASSAVQSTAPGVTNIAAIANMPLVGLGQYNAYSGQAGGAGGIPSGGSGGSITYPTTGLLLSGGAGGGGGNLNGGDVALLAGATSPAQPSYVYFSGLAGGTAGAPGNPGLSSYEIQQPLLSLGASGGGAGSTNNDNGGSGRRAALGSGGSGGGAGATGAGGGAGGAGLVIIHSW